MASSITTSLKPGERGERLEGMGNVWFNFAIGVLVGTVGWLVKRLVRDIDSDIAALTQKVDKLNERLTNHIEISYKR